VERDDIAWWDRHVAFRDWLRAHPADRDEYATLKRSLATAFRLDRAGYTDAKAGFVREIEARAATSTGLSQHGDDVPPRASSAG
jgi:GrpB-like predicted nucleotidyltransferase (UPF0157 family)